MKQFKHLPSPKKSDLPPEIQDHFQPPNQHLVRLEGHPPTQLKPLALEFWSHRTGWEPHFEADYYDWLRINNLQYVIAKGKREVFLYNPWEKIKTSLIDMEPVEFPGPYRLGGNWMFKFVRLTDDRWLLSTPKPDADTDGEESWMELTLRDATGKVLDRLDWPMRDKVKSNETKQLCLFQLHVTCEGRVLIAMEQPLVLVVGIYGDKLSIIGKAKYSRGIQVLGNGTRVWLEQESGNQKNRWFELDGFEEMWEGYKGEI